MSDGEILILGAIAGFTIFLGLPIGRMRDPSLALKAFLNAVAVGILLFLFWDVLAGSFDTVETALTNASDHGGSWWRFIGLAAVFFVAIAVGLVSLVHYDRWLSRRRTGAPGAASIDEMSRGPIARLTEPHRLAFFVALGIGFHNFSEGLAIGQSAAAGEISLALLLIIGFGLHNATEGFGIVAPMAAEDDRPSWSFLVLLGLIGGGPTFLGTLIGQSFVNDTVFMACLALAAGSILYVVIELLGVARKLGHKELMTWGIVLGLFAGFATDLILVAAGA
ncbi:MAG TPA: ZIP family metal transporter [Acidimicrobiia bacterium]|jgi:ZIP family zinc transporter|nr:ZIP family metal transporter [Acidimicrobiia bacterium]